MADFFDDFAPVESAPAPTGAETVSDPAADFLAAEQSDLAQIEQNVYDEVPQTQDSFDPFGAEAPVVNQTEPVEDLGFIESATVVQPDEPVLEIEPEPVLSEPVVAAPPVQAFTMPKIEPEIIKQWKEDFKIRCEEIEKKADEEAEQWRAQAKEALDKFYADRDEILAKNKKVNRENADALRVEQEDFDPNDGKTDQAKWELVTQRIDFNAKGSCTKDTTRMRQVLLQLKSGGSE